MDLKEVDALGIDVNSHWYYSAKAAALLSFLGGLQISKILDVGAGSGFFSRYLLKNTSAQSACCVDINYNLDCVEQEGGKRIFFFNKIKTSDASLVLLMDVLEHVENDLVFLKSYVEKVSVGTDFLITVPAFNFLWSSHDEFLGHHRRYSIFQVESLIKSCGLKVVRSSYYFGLVFPIALILRLLDKLNKSRARSHSHLTKHSFLSNSILRLLCKMEMILFKFNRVAGLTVFCLAKKCKAD